MCARVRGGTGHCPSRLGVSWSEGLSHGPERAGLALVKQPSEARLAPQALGLIGAEGTGTLRDPGFFWAGPTCRLHLRESDGQGDGQRGPQVLGSVPCMPCPRRSGLRPLSWTLPFSRPQGQLPASCVCPLPMWGALGGSCPPGPHVPAHLPAPEAPVMTCRLSPAALSPFFTLASG